MNKDIRVIIVSDQEHEKVVAEIYYGEKFVATVSQDDGNAIVEIPGHNLDQSCITREIPLKEFQKALDLALLKLKG